MAQVMGECIASRFWKGLPVARLLELAKDLLVAVKGQVFPIELEGRAPELRKQHLVTLLRAMADMTQHTHAVSRDCRRWRTSSSPRATDKGCATLAVGTLSWGQMVFPS